MRKNITIAVLAILALGTGWLIWDSYAAINRPSANRQAAEDLQKKLDAINASP